MAEKRKRLFHLIRSDFQRRAELDGQKKLYPYLFTLLLNQSLLGLVIYRFSHFFYTKKIYALAKLGTLLNQNLCYMSIDPRAEIGERFAVGHAFGICIFGNAVIGNNVTVYQGVTITIGPRKGMKPDDKVVIEDNVSIYAGAIVVGNITIGKNSNIGANTVIKNSLPPNSIALAPDPVVVIKKEDLEH